LVSHHSSRIVVLICLLLGLAPTIRSSQVLQADQESRRVSRLSGFAESVGQIMDLLDRGHGIEAETNSRELLKVVETSLGPDALEVATVLDLLGRAVRLSSKVPEEEKARFAERSLSIREKALELWDPDVATSLTNLAIQRTLAGNPTDALPLLDRAVAIREKAYGPDALSVAATLGSRAGVLMTLRDDAGAKAVLERILRIRESKQGSNHIETIQTLLKVALFYAEIGEYDGARRYYERAAGGAEQAFGPNAQAVFDIRLRQAIVLSEGLGDYAASADLNERLIAQAETH
jgi:tetratricopeptide (TPR) repeat protein